MIAPRCPIAREVCAIDVPPLRLLAGELVACHFPGELKVVGVKPPDPVTAQVPTA